MPLPWSGDRPPFGFTADGVAPWLPQPPGWSALTVAAQEADPDSTLSLYRAALRLRRSLRELHAAPLSWRPSGDEVLAFERGPSFRCVVNLSAGPVALRDGAARQRALRRPPARHRRLALDPGPAEPRRCRCGWRALGKGDRLTAGSRLETRPRRGDWRWARAWRPWPCAHGRPDRGAGTPAGAGLDGRAGGCPRAPGCGEPPGRRQPWAVAAVLARLVVAGATLLRQHAAEQELRQRVVLTTLFGIMSSSTDPPAALSSSSSSCATTGRHRARRRGQGLGLRMRGLPPACCC